MSSSESGVTSIEYFGNDINGIEIRSTDVISLAVKIFAVHFISSVKRYVKLWQCLCKGTRNDGKCNQMTRRKRKGNGKLLPEVQIYFDEQTLIKLRAFDARPTVVMAKSLK